MFDYTSNNFQEVFRAQLPEDEKKTYDELKDKKIKCVKKNCKSKKKQIGCTLKKCSSEKIAYENAFGEKMDEFNNSLAYEGDDKIKHNKAKDAVYECRENNCKEMEKELDDLWDTIVKQKFNKNTKESKEYDKKQKLQDKCIAKKCKKVIDKNTKLDKKSIKTKKRNLKKLSKKYKIKKTKSNKTKSNKNLKK